jgi:RHS repeat-associated protein
MLVSGVDEVFTRTDSSGTANFVTDALGSTLALTNNSESTVASYAYDPFGSSTQTGTSANSYQYTSRENDGDGIYFYRARYYSPMLERFISEDPARLRGGLNFYSYVMNSPLNGTDPSGLWTVNIGGNVSISIEGVNIFNFTGGFVLDSDGNFGSYQTYGGGAAVNTGLSGSLSLTGGASSARTICSFAGPFVEVGGRAGLGPDGGASGYVGQEKDGTPIYGGSASVGVGAGAEAYDDITLTYVTPLFGRKVASGCPAPKLF